MELSKLSDKEYHRCLRHYKQYIIGCIEDNRKSEERIIPKTLSEYAKDIYAVKENK